MKKIIPMFFAALLAGQALAADFQPFQQAKFDALQKDGKPVLVDIYADWCPVCHRQEQVLKPMLQEPEFKNLTVLKVDFDSQKQEVKAFKANRQSTLILFNGGKEVRRSVGETNPQRLRQFVTLPH
ncbi:MULTISPECIES: thioredoxin family protein [unclassified Neisseria]|uniref:thioredoxin family protein n=1 Tax=unclassified Neisseria TaxID=2623750 RepID=UPI0026666F9D|nr:MULTISPECIES: thioredoxin family protein [unclassified Neisseria]MDO1508867.1 thioredoxin family protein [Neisseria sp. MVDL19-042950]MDO1515126.1 thioredoxin family protein [Neisseria sp. MVDL18-041461]MDO1562486.1 thioredoxin family protein [Neisseria sp. MVDL20-010259]